MSIIATIRDDDAYKKFKSIVTNARSKVDPDAIYKEAMTLHASRLSRSMMGNDRYSSKRIVDAKYKDMQVRSRLVEIRQRADKNISYVRKAIKSLSAHIMIEYAEDLKEEGYKGLNEKRALITRVTKIASEFLADAESAIDSIDQLIKDLDQASHSFHQITESLKLLVTKRGDL